MITKEKIDRINELAAKAKSQEGLNEEELTERDLLRKEYIQAMRKNVKEHLDNIRYVEDLPKEKSQNKKN